ncbi:alanine racemase [Phaeovulum vinaykumarii]|uniref:Alanine racemase n=1 Tax=Phaeovulum vinaykumarii TaxID=407234 RepID=A0A1N7LWM4_9RHOB|nr:alanine racemase [Phaeovulum vinaykumarii]SIS78248.1 alanine racemase [Phaeovulum vinaykumarii]SOC07108.1 alanine racemase [Phaeovulum vinaykumarii]
MSSPLLSIDLDAIVENWRVLDARSGAGTQSAAVVKADAYGLGADRVAPALHRAGARTFFVALTEEGARLRPLLGPEVEICVLSGHMEGDAPLIEAHALTPMLNSLDQVTRHFETLPGAPFGIQLDTGMNRLGMEMPEWEAVAGVVLNAGPRLLMSHLACADEPGHPANAAQLAEFHRMTDGTGVARSLSATGGILLGRDYHFDITRPGIGLYGCAPFTDARPVVRLSLPVIQSRGVAAGESVGYGYTWTAPHDSVVATVAAGYADGVHRRLAGKGRLWAGDTPCPILGRVSMDLITVDISHLEHEPATLDLLGPAQGADAVADQIGTIGYEVLTALGPRYRRQYIGGAD